MDIEWAKDGDDGELYILQARPETVKSREQSLERYILHTRSEKRKRLSGSTETVVIVWPSVFLSV